MKKLNSIFIIAAALLIPMAAFASGSAESGHESGMWKGFMWQVINFAILATALYFVGKGPLKQMLKSRTETIERGISEAAKAKEASSEALSEVRAEMDLKDSRIASMIKSAEESGVKERENLIEEGRKMSQRILDQAKSNIDAELRLAKQELRAEAAAMALSEAERKIAQKLTESEHRALIEETMKKLEAHK